MSTKGSTPDISIPHLMGELRSLMAKEMSPAKRVNNVLALLCEDLHLPTAALYIMRPGDVLERIVMAGKVIKIPEFVRIGDGVVGMVAMERESIFEIGKTAPYRTVVAVPLIRGNQVLGVLNLLTHKL